MFQFNSGGWTFDYEMLAQGGLVLRNVKHDNYNLARNIRVVGIWVFPLSETETPKYFLLGSDDFDVEPTGNLPYQRYTNFKAPPPFDIYSQASNGPVGLQAKYSTKTRVFYGGTGPDDDPDDDRLRIQQDYILTSYGKNPAHEPGGVLQATRMFPLIKFFYGGRKIKSIRVDYRFDMTIDLFLKEADPLLDKGLKKIANTAIQQAFPMMGGVFRDSENFPTSDTALSVLFAAAEKPCKYELSSFGLKEGFPGDKITTSQSGVSMGMATVVMDEARVLPEDMTTWDNIHLWSNKKISGTYLKKQISSPGAFHCFHLHWRWSRLTADLLQVEKYIIKKNSPGEKTAAGEKQFKGIDIAGSAIGGPLLDPKIPRQTIRFAITKSQDQEYEKLESKSNGVNFWDPDVFPVSKENFEDIFFSSSTKKPLPRDISQGENLLLWMSFEVFLPNSSIPKYEGTVFPHGFYFAHNPEPADNPFKGTIDKEAQNPSYSSPIWQRYPNGK